MRSLRRASSRRRRPCAASRSSSCRRRRIPPCAIAASYAAKAFGIKTGTLVREARSICPDVIPVQANHRLYTEYHERILKAVDTCLPVEKVMLDRRNGVPPDGNRAAGAGRARTGA